jgi:AraC-like DNA-binding protein
LDVISVFKSVGFELIDDKKGRTIEQVKNLIIELVHHKNNDLRVNLSNYLSQHLNQEYKSLSKLFSVVEQQTIEQFFIKQKIEKVKELLMYDELTLSQIAYQLNYSSVAYLSNQFKRETGFTTSYFKQLKSSKRTGIDSV